jgi:alpha-glucosidase (family GH31 glycosyl hydrolase)
MQQATRACVWVLANVAREIKVRPNSTDEGCITLHMIPGMPPAFKLRNPRWPSPTCWLQVWPGPTHFPDFLNPATPAWWAGQLSAFHPVAPYDGIWLDMNEPSNFCEGEVCHPFPTTPATAVAASNLSRTQRAPAAHRKQRRRGGEQNCVLDCRQPRCVGLELVDVVLCNGQHAVCALSTMCCARVIAVSRIHVLLCWLQSQQPHSQQHQHQLVARTQHTIAPVPCTGTR